MRKNIGFVLIDFPISQKPLGLRRICASYHDLQSEIEPDWWPLQSLNQFFLAFQISPRLQLLYAVLLKSWVVEPFLVRVLLRTCYKITIGLKIKLNCFEFSPSEPKFTRESWNFVHNAEGHRTFSFQDKNIASNVKKKRKVSSLLNRKFIASTKVMLKPELFSFQSTQGHMNGAFDRGTNGEVFLYVLERIIKNLKIYISVFECCRPAKHARFIVFFEWIWVPEKVAKY